jgi:hypothetical protein
MSPINSFPPSQMPRSIGLTPKNNLSGGVGRAQNLYVSKLNYQKDISNAKVSMNQLDSKRVGAVSSVTHLTGQNTVSTSVAGKARDAGSIYGEGYDAEADEKRYDFVRSRAMANRRKREEANAGSIYNTGVKTGGLFKTTGLTGLKRQLIRMRYGKPGEFRNLTARDRKYFTDMVSGHAKAVSAGAGFGHHARRSMKQQLLRDKRASKINAETYKDFNNMVDKLPGVRRGIL